MMRRRTRPRSPESAPWSSGAACGKGRSPTPIVVPRRPGEHSYPHVSAHRGAGACRLPHVITWRSGEVASLGRSWHGAQELLVLVGTEQTRALAYPDLVGTPRIGDRVLLNTTALARGLGRSEEHTSELQSRGHLVC